MINRRFEAVPPTLSIYRPDRRILPLGARPHWGKCFVAGAEQLEPLYPRMGDFRALRSEWDPDGTFDNAYLRRVIG